MLKFPNGSGEYKFRKLLSEIKLSEGVNAGSFEGCSKLGLFVGITEGAYVGSLVDLNVGVNVGSNVAAFVGESVGTHVS